MIKLKSKMSSICICEHLEHHFVNKEELVPKVASIRWITELVNVTIEKRKEIFIQFCQVKI